MKRICVSALALVLLLILANAASAQERRNSSKPDPHSFGPGKAAVIVVSSATKATWAVTKFTARRVVRPAAVHVLKPILFKGAPIAGRLALKATGVGAKHLLPYAVKLSLL